MLNLTTPDAHAAIAAAAIAAGKSVYNEKPLAVALEDGRRLVADAAAAGVRLGAAPDTLLGGGLQTCRQLLDEGAIGQPVAATAFMLNHGHEGWHPNPDFYYQPGGGPLFDMGPYYLTALVAPPRPRPPRHRLGPRLLPRAHDHQPAPRRRDDPGRDRHPPRRRPRLPRRRDRDPRHLLRRLGQRRPQAGAPRRPRQPRPPRPQHLRRPRPRPPRRGRRLARRPDLAPLHRQQPRPRPRRPRRRPPLRPPPTAPAATSPSTSSKSCTPSRPPPLKAATSRSPAAPSGPPPSLSTPRNRMPKSASIEDWTASLPLSRAASMNRGGEGAGGQP